MDNIEFSEYNVTCHTVGCENAEITLLITAPTVEPYIVCGVCGIEITDVVEQTEGE
jgi:hypothetical protein